jgi:hypothetical protein
VIRVSDLPHRYTLPHGTYTVSITAVLAEAVEGPRYAVTVTTGPHAGQLFRLTIPAAYQFVGHGFLENDDFSVMVKHIPNWEQRLRLSVKAAK